LASRRIENLGANIEIERPGQRRGLGTKSKPAPLWGLRERKFGKALDPETVPSWDTRRGEKTGEEAGRKAKDNRPYPSITKWEGEEVNSRERVSVVGATRL